MPSLDINLPDIDGFEVVRRLRASGWMGPVLFLSARGTTEDRVRGLTMGGDDYVTKPFALEELVARVQVALRRTGKLERRRLQVGDVVLDDDAHEVRVAGEPVHLTPPSTNCFAYCCLTSVVSSALRYLTASGSIASMVNRRLLKHLSHSCAGKLITAKRN